MKLKFAFYKSDSAISVEVARSTAGQVSGEWGEEKCPESRNSGSLNKELLHCGEH